MKFTNIILNSLFELVIIQIVLPVAKYIIIGIAESIVGSVASQGGALATVFPMLGFMFIWLKKRGKLESRDWIFIIGLAFIGFLSYEKSDLVHYANIDSPVYILHPQRKIPT